MKNLYLSVFILSSFLTRAQVTPPTQPTTGPGSNVYIHDSVTIYDYAPIMHADGFWLYEPASPKPDSANVVVFCHGLGETNLIGYGGLIEHLVRQGNIVIAPRYQQDGNTFATTTNANSTFNDSCAKGILRALDTLKQPGHVIPRLQNFFVCGHSVGGILTANMACTYAHYGFPKPLAAFSMQPGSITLTPIFIPDYSVMDSDIKYLIAVGSNDAIVDTAMGLKLFNETTNVPYSHKNLIEQYPDNHGTPALGATHFEPLSCESAYTNNESQIVITVSTSGTNCVIDAVDYYCYWKLMDALMDCALTGQNCDVAFGDTYAQKYMGQWSDGTPVRPLDVRPRTATGINDVTGNAISVKLYPNPVSSNVYLQIPDFKAGDDLQIEFYDVAGRKLFEKKVGSAWEQYNVNFPSGIYFYRVSNGAKQVLANGKFVSE